MGTNSSYRAMFDIVEQAKEGTILTPDDLQYSRCFSVGIKPIMRICGNT